MPPPPRAPALPIEAHLEAIGQRVVAGNLVLVAAPGAGKTTRVPPAILAALRRRDPDPGEIVVLAPRRLAARLAAERVAAELGEAVGERCGYQVRFDAKVSARTRIRFMTEGLLVRRLRDDPELAGVAVVIFDELHERHLDADLALALTRRLQLGPRPDLRLVAMSATMDSAPGAAFLDAPVVEVPGRSYPVDISYAPGGDRPLERQVLRALTDLVETGLEGHVLVFLPGAAEIRRCAEACAGYLRAHGLELHTLHGELDAADQDRAVAPPPDPSVRKVILSTNVAETSVTIEGVCAVIDSGLARIASHDPWTGVARLDLGSISQAAATQRAGRAGRTGPGRCVRLYGRGDLERRRAFERPEVERLDLSGLGLEVAAAGSTLRDLAWLEAPPEASVAAARRLLAELGAIAGPDDDLSAVGRRMLRFPTTPRLARLIVAGEDRGVGGLAADVAAVLSERPLDPDPRRVATGDSAADPLVDLARLEGRDRGLDPRSARQIGQVRRQLRRALGRAHPPELPPGAGADAALGRALLAAFPDHVAQVQDDAGREPGALRGTRRLVLAGGGAALLGPASHVRSASWCIALRADTRAGGGTGARTVVRAAAALDPDWLLEDRTAEIEEVQALAFDEARERIELRSELRYRGLVLERATRAAPPGPEATALLERVALARGFAAFCDPEALAQLRHRVAFVARHRPELLRAVDDAALAHTLRAACAGCTDLRALREAPLLHSLRAQLGAGATQLDALAPAHVQLPGGRRLAVHYEADRDPWVASRLQDFFGLARGPALLGGQVPAVLHLRAPNNRDVQVTTDLASFWARHYPELRRALMRRYPRHAWPEDPVSASPPAAGGVRPTSRRRR